MRRVLMAHTLQQRVNTLAREPLRVTLSGAILPQHLLQTLGHLLGFVRRVEAQTVGQQAPTLPHDLVPALGLQPARGEQQARK